MKTFKKLLIILAAIIPAAPVAAQTKKQQREAAKVVQVKELIGLRNFTFKANYMYPLGGGQRYLTSDYDLRVTKDSVIAFLPYFGVAYFGVGYNNPDDNGIKFTSTKFDYQSQIKKNGNWYITIKPQDVKYTNQLALNISPNGFSDLSVISTNRQQIRFSGIIKDKPQIKK